MWLYEFMLFVFFCAGIFEARLLGYPEDPLLLCAVQTSCKSCLESSSSCAWCSEWNFSNSTVGRLRCSSADRLEAFGCPRNSIKLASAGLVSVVTDKKFQDVDKSYAPPVQLRPQGIKVKLRPHSTETVHIQYRAASNYPLDLYLLMDLTWSMKDDKDTIVSLGQEMAHTLGTFTENVRLGFGSYADKPLMPYVFPGHEDNPCRSEGSVCAPLYSFKHHLTLSDDIRRFIQQVNASHVTGNVDNLEGGMDGVVQAIVCMKQVGWARHARKLMLIATDGFMHFAGEGKLGGVVQRHDFSCHLDEAGEYSMSKFFDYPSLAEISRLLNRKKINLIFAVTEDRRSEYEQIAGLLKEKARVATLTSNSSNILEIIRQSYHDILTKIVLRDNSSAPVDLRYYSNCGKVGRKKKITSECDDIQLGKIYNFTIELSLKDCPKDSKLWTQRIVIDDALASEASKTIIDVQLQCGCDCENPNSPHCNHGIDECGICKCDHAWSGETCDCDESAWTENRLLCIAPQESRTCSNRGECTCGSCTCDPGYNGKYCECTACEKINGIECKGRGTCNCGVCNCLEGWAGDSCQCPTGNELCIAPGSTDICGNHGYCDCGQCRCNVTSPGDGLLYRGVYCESSASAGGSGLCVLYEACVNATIETPEIADKVCHRDGNNSYGTEIIDTVDIDSDHYCIIRTVRDNVICTIPYVYYFTRENQVLLKIAPKDCRTRLSAAVIPSTIFALIVGLGILALLIWRCVTAIKDRKEYARFEEEQKRTVYALSENPLYRPARSFFTVPENFKED
ncbi:integrin beta-nu-like [Diachasmimorpha longicaudata]|uniref:integrin beta-nu-like n=1 Tax=Diachasmimorpha longicaudata TaxID=58733 RepID=UPI0030B8CDD9